MRVSSASGPRRGPEERPHVLGGVVEAAGLLERRAAAQIDETPELADVPPGTTARSTARTSASDCRAATTADDPATPRPTTTTSTVSSN